MADFTALKTAIQNAIKQNGNEEITGNLLQEVLLAIVITLGDGSINDLITALGSEATTRGNADTTLQQNINAEAQARQQAVSAEAQARSNADTALGGRIDGVIESINAINTAIGNGYVYAGIATPSSTPTTGKVFYLALTAGTYTNFGNIAVTQGINILKYNGSAWSLDAFVGIDDTPTPSSNNLIKSGGAFDFVMKNGSAFDLSAYNNGTTYADLNAALTALNALPAAYKRGGMSFRFVLTSDNKYVQYRLMSDEFIADTTQWAIADEGVYVENPEYVYVETDKEGKILWAIKSDGSIYYGAGVPQQIKDYIEEKISSLSLDEYEDIVSFLSDYLGSDTTLKALLDSKLDTEGLDPEALGAVQAVESPEYTQVTTDNEGKILEGISSRGVKKINLPIETPSAIIEHMENPEWINVTTDSDGRILGGRKQNGTVVENFPIENPDIVKMKELLDLDSVTANEIKTITNIGTPQTLLSTHDESATTWDNMHIGFCQVLKISDNMYYLYYWGFGTDTPKTEEGTPSVEKGTLRFAYSTDGINWVRDYPSYITNPPSSESWVGPAVQFWSGNVGSYEVGHTSVCVFKAIWDTEYPYRAINSDSVDMYIYKSKDGVTFTNRKLIEHHWRDNQPCVIVRGNVLKIYNRLRPANGRYIAVMYCDLDGNILSPSRYYFGKDGLYMAAASVLDDRREILFPTVFNRTSLYPHDPEGIECYIVDGNNVLQVPIDASIFTNDGEFKSLYTAINGLIDFNGEQYLYYSVSGRYHDVYETQSVVPSYPAEIRRVKIEFGNIKYVSNN